MILAAAVALFALLHLVPAVPPAKSWLRQRLGRAYGMVFAAGSIITLLLVVLAWPYADRSTVYEPPEWGFAANLVLSFVAFLLLGIFFFRGRLRQKLKFPLAIAVCFWATGHLLANGDSASIILFGGLLAYAVAHLVLGIMNSVGPDTQVRQGHDALSIAAGVALYGVMIQLHAHLIGVPLFSIHDLSILAG